MELLHLSTEILLQVFSYLGPEFFTEDISRLSVSQRWYSLARQILCQHIHLSLLSLPKFYLFTQGQDATADLRRCTRSINIWVPSIDDWLFPIARPSPDCLDDEYWNLLKAKVADIHKAFSGLTETLKGSIALRSFSISAHAETLYFAPSSFMPFVHTPSLASFLSLSHITSLELDIGYLPNDAREGEDSQVHICTVINSLLPRLKRLHYRMATICEQLLQLPPGDSLLDLEELIISLGLGDGHKGPSRAVVASHCKTPVVGLLQIYIRSRVKHIVPRLRNPKVVGVISYQELSFHKFYFNALTGSLDLLVPGTGPWEVHNKSQVES